MVNGTRVTLAFDRPTASPPRAGGSQSRGSRTTTATCSITLAEVLHAVPYTLSGDTSIRAAPSRSDRSRKYEPAGEAPEEARPKSQHAARLHVSIFRPC